MFVEMLYMKIEMVKLSEIYILFIARPYFDKTFYLATLKLLLLELSQQLYEVHVIVCSLHTCGLLG